MQRKLVFTLCLAAFICTMAPAYAGQGDMKAEAPLTGKAWQLADTAYKAYGRADYRQAERAAQGAIALRPDVLRLRLLLVYSLQKQDKAGELKRAAEQALQAGFDDPVFRSLAQEQQAAPANQANAVADTAAQQAYAAYARADYQEAIAQARQAAQLAPGDAGRQQLLTTALAAGDRRQKTEALERLNQALAAQPDDAQLLMQRGYLHQYFTQPAKALDDFRNARATGRAPAAAVLDEGYAQAASGDKRGAVTTLKTAIDDADANRLQLSPEQRNASRQNIAGLSREWGGYVSTGYRAGRAASSNLGGTPVIRPGDATFGVAEGYWRPSNFLNTSTQVFEVYGRVAGILHSGSSSLESQVDPCLGQVDTSNTFKSVSGFPSTTGTAGLRFTPSTDLGLTFGLERQFNLGSATRTNGIAAKDCHDFDPTKIVASYKTKTGSGPWLAYMTYGYYKGTQLRTDVPSWLTIDSYAQLAYSWERSTARIQGQGNGASFGGSGELTRGQALAVAEMRVGRSFRMDSVSNRLVLFPHVVVAGDKIWNKTRISRTQFGSLDLRESGVTWSAAVGPGLNVRYWFRDDHYSAARSYADFSIQYRFNVGGGAADRAKGLFLNLTMSY